MDCILPKSGLRTYKVGSVHDAIFHWQCAVNGEVQNLLLLFALRGRLASLIGRFLLLQATAKINASSGIHL